jgi:hypothetical protein
MRWWLEESGLSAARVSDMGDAAQGRRHRAGTKLTRWARTNVSIASPSGWDRQRVVDYGVDDHSKDRAARARACHRFSLDEIEQLAYALWGRHVRPASSQSASTSDRERSHRTRSSRRAR